MIKIDFAKDFSFYGGPRYKHEGESSGEEFRDEILYPKVKEAVENGEYVTVYLNNISGMSVAFIDEAFGGLVRKYNISKDFLCENLCIQCDDESYYTEIWKSIEESVFSGILKGDTIKDFNEATSLNGKFVKYHIDGDEYNWSLDKFVKLEDHDEVTPVSQVVKYRGSISYEIFYGANGKDVHIYCFDDSFNVWIYDGEKYETVYCDNEYNYRDLEIVTEEMVKETLNEELKKCIERISNG